MSLVINISHTDSFYKNIVLYMTQFWVCSGVSLLTIPDFYVLASTVLVLQQFLGGDRLRIVDIIHVQRDFHRLAQHRKQHCEIKHRAPQPVARIISCRLFQITPEQDHGEGEEDLTNCM